MKKTLIFIILVMLVFVGMQSCIYDEEPASTLPQGIQMGFTIHVAGNSTASRGADDKTEEGNDWENTIDIENRDFRVYIYTTEADGSKEAHTYLATLDVISALPMTDDDQPYKDYYVVGNISADLKTKLEKGFHLVIWANCSGWGQMDRSTFGYYDLQTELTDEQKNKRDLGKDEATWFEYFYRIGARDSKKFHETNTQKGFYNIVGETRRIPMWGINTYTNVEFVENQITKLEEPVDMLRAFAKIEVMVADDSDLMLDDAYLNYYRGKIAIEPNIEAYQGNNGIYKTNPNFTQQKVPGGERYVPDGDQTKLLFLHETIENKKFEVYVPECEDNTTGNAKRYLNFGVTVNGQEINIDLRNAPTNLYAFLRNHIYRFKIKEEEKDYVIAYEVQNWSEQTINVPPFGVLNNQ